jgi:bis(5'-nucleosyl)-tetraphosphatase (symmetrical)
MATWAIGDIQGCFDELQALLKKINFDKDRDRLWFCGDLVNRGPKSLETLRLVRKINAVTVLGNHDLHLLACAYSKQRCRRKDTLNRILAAPDADKLLDWLRRQPLLHHDPDSGYTLIHAGLPPQWDLRTAMRCAEEVQTVLRGKRCGKFLEAMYGDQPERWDESLRGMDRLRFTTNCLTRLRYCDAKGRLALQQKGTPGSQPDHLRPWFAWPKRKSRKTKIIFGHWSTLGALDAPGIHAIDTGCLWGGSLTALRVRKKPLRVRYGCPGARKPG